MTTMTRRFAVLALLGALAGCTPSPPASAPPASAPPASDRSAAAPSTSASPAFALPSLEPSARAGFGGPASTVTVVDEAMFQTPSKNIACHLTSSAVRCDIGRKTWRPPPKPADCELNWGSGLFLDAGRAGLTCAGDTLLGAATETLAYGTGRQAGDIRCDSADSGLTCRDNRSGHGFTLAAAGYTTF